MEDHLPFPHFHHFHQHSHHPHQNPHHHQPASDRSGGGPLAPSSLNTNPNAGVGGLGAGGLGGRDHDDKGLYRLSTGTSNFDFERTPTSIDGGELSNSLANWRRRLDLEEQEEAAAAGGGGVGDKKGNGEDERDGEATPRRKASGGDTAGTAGGNGGSAGTGGGPPLI